MQCGCGCGAEFEPRKGGKPQRFISEAHRGAFKRALHAGSADNPLIAAKCPGCGLWHAKAAAPESDADKICERCKRYAIASAQTVTEAAAIGI